METSITLASILAGVGGISTVLAIIVAVVSLKKGVKGDGAQNGALLSDVGYIKAGVDDVKREQKEISEKYNKLSERVIALESSDKSAHHRIDRIDAVLDDKKA